MSRSYQHRQLQEHVTPVASDPASSTAHVAVVSGHGYSIPKLPSGWRIGGSVKSVPGLSVNPLGPRREP
jgi:hypothetical protein